MFLDLDRFKAINDTLCSSGSATCCLSKLRSGSVTSLNFATKFRRVLSCRVVSWRVLAAMNLQIVLPAFDLAAAIETLADEIVETIGRPYV